MVNQSRADWRKFSTRQGGSQRTGSQANHEATQEGAERQQPPKRTRMGTALQGRARELKLYNPSNETSQVDEEDVDAPGVIDSGLKMQTSVAEAGGPDEPCRGSERVDGAMGVERRRAEEMLWPPSEQRKPSPMLSGGLLQPATYPNNQDAVVNCLSILPTARTALEYAQNNVVSPAAMRPPGHIRAPAAVMPQEDKLSMYSSQADSVGGGAFYDPLTASEPQYGTEPSLGPMGGFYDNTVKAYIPAGGEQGVLVRRQHGHRGAPQDYREERGGYERGYNRDEHFRTPRNKQSLSHPMHDTSSPSPALAHTPLTRLKLSSYLAEAVCSNGESLGLFPNELYDWQAECLGKDEGICGGLRKNLVVSAPTSSGKTLVAEILMLRALGDDQQLLKQSRKALFVLPYISLCEEKAKRLSKLITPLSRHVKKAYGGEHSRQMWDPDTGIIVCTPENANSMLNRIIEDGTPIEEEICCVVVDELHLVGRDDRGTVLEMLLSKFAFLSKLIRHTSGPQAQTNREQSSTPVTPVTQNTPSDRFLQIIGLTATLPNIEEIGRWLNAVPFSCDFRPVPLREYLKEANGEVKLKQRTGRLTGPNAVDPEYDLFTARPTLLPADSEDPDHVGYLAYEAVAMGKSVMIFCATKKGCQQTAKALVAYFRRQALAAAAGSTRQIPQPSKEILEARETCAYEIGKKKFEYSQSLAEAISQGACFHHGDLTPIDRCLVEAAFRQGYVKILCATSTLGTGVNLPIFRIIFKDAYQGMFATSTYISQETYRQISGRAGRTGVDEWGESFLIVRKNLGNHRVPRSHLRELLVGSLDRVVSSVVVGGVPSRERCDRLVLEMLATAQSQRQGMDENTLNMIMESTLVWAAAAGDRHKDIAAMVESSLEWLGTNFSETRGQRRRFGVRDIDDSPMLERNQLDGREVIEVTQLGKAVIASNMAPQEALMYMKDLNVALNQGFVTGNHLHVLYMCVPLTCTQISMNRSLYRKLLKIVSQADSVERRVHEILGLSERFLTVASQIDNVRLKTAEDERQARICLRLYIAYMLYAMILGSTTNKIMQDFEITSGKLLESLKEDVERFGKKAASLCRSMGKEVIAGSLQEFASEVRKTNDESFQRLLGCGIEKRDAIFLIHLDVTSPEQIIEKGKDELVRLLQNAYAVEGRDVDTHRLQAKVIKLINAASAYTKNPSHALENIVTARQGDQLADKMEAGSAMGGDGRVGTSQVAQGRLQSPKKNNISNWGVSEEPLNGEGRFGLGTGNAPGNDSSVARTDSGGNRSGDHKSSRWQKIFCAVASNELVAIYMHASNLVDKKGRRTPETEMPKGRKPKPPEKMPIGISISWDLEDEYVALKGQPHAADFLTRLKSALSRRPLSAHIAMFGWHNQISVLEDLVELELSQIINIKLAMWILEPDRYEQLVTNKFKKPTSSFGGKKRNRGEPKTNRLQIRQTFHTASFETEAHEYCREILKLLDSEGTLDHYPGLKVDPGEGHQEPSSIHLRISRKALRCLSSMMPILKSTGLLRPLIETEMPICRIVGVMEERGVGFRQTWLYDENRRLLETQAKVSKRAAIVLQADTGESRAVDLASTNELATILYSRPYYAFPPPEINRIRHKFTSTSKDALMELKNKYPENKFLPLISLYRSLADLASTIVTLGRFKDGDGKLRTNYLQTSAGTGRIATDEPNLQCLQKRKVLHFDDIVVDISLRKCIVAPTPGRVILSADFKHIEFRVMAHLADDPSMQGIMRRVDCDPFKLLASEWKPSEFPTEDSVTPQAREHCKMLCYALLYGMGENRLAAELKIKPSEAAATRREFLDKFPSVSQWIEKEVRVCTEKKYITTLNGRIRWLDNIQNEIDSGALAEDQRAAVNSICQGSAADMMKFAMIGIERRIKREFGVNPPCAALLQIHDELLFEVEKERLPEAVRVIKEEMEGAWVGLAVPLKVSFKVGPSWGEIEELNEPFVYRNV